jgi:(p)ppGpp synthase/HD superfamily hydrolase
MSSTLTAEEIEVRREFNDLLDTCTRCNKRGDKALIRKAFKIAYNALRVHCDIRRAYILHPLAVANRPEMGLV